jgi:hypothetical protein
MFDRWFNTISTTDVKESTLLHAYFIRCLIYFCSRRPSRLFYNSNRQSTLLKAKGHVWHKSSMKSGLIPRPGIDTDARWWGYSHTKGWIFRYELLLTCTTAAIGDLVVPLLQQM